MRAVGAPLLSASCRSSLHKKRWTDSGNALFIAFAYYNGKLDPQEILTEKRGFSAGGGLAKKRLVEIIPPLPNDSGRIPGPPLNSGMTDETIMRSFPKKPAIR